MLSEVPARMLGSYKKDHDAEHDTIDYIYKEAMATMRHLHSPMQFRERD